MPYLKPQGRVLKHMQDKTSTKFLILADGYTREHLAWEAQFLIKEHTQFARGIKVLWQKMTKMIARKERGPYPLVREFVWRFQIWFKMVDIMVKKGLVEKRLEGFMKDKGIIGIGKGLLKEDWEGYGAGAVMEEDHIEGEDMDGEDAEDMPGLK